jgi:hypothetical protein
MTTAVMDSPSVPRPNPNATEGATLAVGITGEKTIKDMIATRNFSPT